MDSVSLIGHTGKRRQHAVYNVRHKETVYTVTPGTGEVTTIREVRGYNSKIFRQVQRIGGPLFDTLIAKALAFAKDRD